MTQKALDRRIAKRNRAEYWKLYQMREAERERQEKQKKEANNGQTETHTNT